MAAMPEENHAEDVEKVLAEEKAVVDRKSKRPVETALTGSAEAEVEK